MSAPRVVTLTVGPMSHGGHCVARHQGRVVFVRHAIPGETVRAVVTEGDSSSKFWRADAVDVLQASDHRRRHPWKQADALRAYDHHQVPVGGADYGHISDLHQRRLKSHVFRDTMARIGGIDLAELDLPSAGADGELHMSALPETSASGLHWRTRVSFAVAGGSLAMKPYRSHDLIPLRSMPLAVEAVGRSHLFSWDFAGAESVDVVAPGGSAPVALVVRAPQDTGGSLAERLTAQAREDPSVGSILLARVKSPAGQRSAGRRRRYHQLRPVQVDYQVLTGERTVTEPLPVPAGEAVQLPPEGFWQIHRGAPKALVSAVDSMARLASGGTAVDLYAGAGLFTAWAAHTVGASGQVLSVEAAEATSAAAAQLFQNHPQVEVVHAPAERIADRLESADVVILDPPRAGADNRVLTGIASSRPGQILYVSCDPASFARDAKVLAELGWQLADLQLLDLYPNTHHMESVARFERN
ncbi:TRAM domain-containing protein [Nesterenkonia sp.]|uniref:class I SAM-dependent RNA methyltransferase n=1 Tax=Nesterenkonia sp. TaxID=704201 RepID=UPI002613B5BA|nr:TRAM domain-containing protein [Nesterenkonia sp.]